MLKKPGLTGKMLIYTAILGVAVWLVSDRYQTATLKSIFHAKLATRFSLQAQEHRTLFDRHVKVYSQLAKLLVRSNSLYHYVEEQKWPATERNPRVKFHQNTPVWMPNHSMLRKFALPRYALLLDTQQQTREVYSWSGIHPPDEVMHPERILLQLSENQSYLTTLAGRPYLITSEPVIAYKKKIGTLVLLSPIDSEFMLESQVLSTSKYTVALLAEDEQTILVSSDPKMVPEGIKVSQLANVYQTIGEGFFDYGSSDLVIKCVSFIPLSEVEELTLAVLDKERSMRLFSGAAYIALFMLVIIMLTRRILNLTQRVVEFSRKMAVPLPDIQSHDELRILESRFEQFANQLQNETEMLEYQASHDPLTDLPNRKMLNERLQNSLLKSRVSGAPLVLIISDLNHFKEINDTLGHHIGDLVLQQAAERLYNTVRKSDTVARLGGDEFSILLPDTNITQAARIAAEIVDVFGIPFVAEGHNLNVGISIGLVESPQHGDDVNILVQRADVAMYDAKRGNKGFSVYNPNEDTHHVSKLELMTDLSQAINNDILELHFQSKLDIKGNHIIGAEALARWNHPERGYIQPDEFIPLAEQTGLIKPLTHYVIREGMRQCSNWRSNGLDLGIAINVSVQCLHDHELTKNLRTYLAEFKLPARCCTIEITESDIMVDPIRAKSVLMEIDSIGCNLSIDDFGTGYSSLAYLKQLPVSEIKIDRSFVMEMINDENDKVIVRTIIDLAHNLDLSVTAEGVTSKEALAMLAELGCNVAQGFYICKPMSADKYLDHLADKQTMIRNIDSEQTDPYPVKVPGKKQLPGV
ncbi:MAG: EAL domain-containing protein [Gammaproteobacteria bacterium]|nr:EAL domain-containing protein [Gammaproteobacteria bacterium]